MSYDASDPGQVRKKQTISRTQEKIREDVVRQIMSYRNGRAWLYSMLELTHVWRSSFSTEALAMAFSEGERNIGLQLAAQIIAAAPKEYVVMMNEAEEPERLDIETKGEEDGRSSTDVSDPT